jgi:hypothetical protein
VLNAAHDAATALANPDPEGKAYRENFGVHNYETFQFALRRERDEFAAGQKTERGTMKMHDMYSKLILAKSNAEPDIFIVDRALQRYMVSIT